MSRRDDLVQHIQESYALVRAYEGKMQLSDDPKEKARCQREKDEQERLIQGWLEELRRLGGELPDDITVLASAQQSGSASGGPAGSGVSELHFHIEHAQGFAIGDSARVEMAGLGAAPERAAGSAGFVSGDIFARYEAGVAELLRRLGKGHARYGEVLTYQQRLQESLSQARLYGDTAARRAERAEVVGYLNALALAAVGTSFNELVEGPLRTDRPLPAKSAPNPFGDTGRIVDPGRFYDREELLRQVFEELAKGGNVSLVGESQVGKSSLLAMVCALGPERLGLPAAALAYLSLQEVESADEFYDALCDRLQIAPCRGYQLTRALQGRRYVLCLDEVEVMAQEQDAFFNVRVRRHLRGLADGPAAPLRLVIASRSPLARLFPDSPELDSPLAGICVSLAVEPFSEEVARAFLAERLQGTGVTFGEDEVRRLLTASGGHPARLQRAAAELYRRLAEG